MQEKINLGTFNDIFQITVVHCAVMPSAVNEGPSLGLKYKFSRLSLLALSLISITVSIFSKFPGLQPLNP